MKTGITSDFFNLYGLAEGLKKMHDLGFDCVDYSMADTTAGLYLYDGTEFEEKVTSLRHEIENAGITVNQIHGPWRYPPQDFAEEDRNERFEKMKKSIRAAKLLGSKYFVIHPIMPFGCGSDPYPDLLWQMNIDFFKRLLPTAVENDVVICYENMPMPALSNASPEAILNFVKEIDSPFFKVCLDTGHCTMFGIQPADAVRLLGKENLRVLHVHDNDGKNDLHWMPYTGVIDWDDFAASLKEIGFDGCVSLETNIDPSLPQDEIENKSIRLADIARRLAGKI